MSMDQGVLDAVGSQLQSIAVGSLPVSSHDSDHRVEQGRLLVVFLLEKLCYNYVQDPERRRRLFKSVFRRLVRMGVLPSMPIDETEHMRRVFGRAFDDLIETAHSSLDDNAESGDEEEIALEGGIFFNRLTWSGSAIGASAAPALFKASRYETEFNEVNRLGRGGFGSVYHAKHRLDSRDYAIKKIKLKSPKQCEKVLREVTALAALEHPAVIRYHAAWLEHDLVLEPCGEDCVFVRDKQIDISSSSPRFRDVSSSLHPTYNFKDSHELSCSPRIRTISDSTNHSSFGLEASNISSSSSGSEDEADHSEACQDETSISFSVNANSNYCIRSSTLGLSAAQRMLYVQQDSDENNRYHDESRCANDWEEFDEEGDDDEVSESEEVDDDDEVSESRYFDEEIDDEEVSKSQYFDEEIDDEEVSESQYFDEEIDDEEVSESQYFDEEIDDEEVSESQYFDEDGNIRCKCQQVRFTLYIQMQLCEFTLHEWLRKRNYSRPDGVAAQVDLRRSMTIFRQLVEGIDYIHSQGILHRDVKPQNVFLRQLSKDGDLQVKIGDFGLSRAVAECEGIQNNLPDDLSSTTSSSMSTGVGTATYASPEQLSREDYDFKADVYSLGIILLEMLCVFSTESERVFTIRDVKEKHSFPPRVIEDFPREAAVMMCMTSPNPEYRPSCSELLHGDSCIFDWDDGDHSSSDSSSRSPQSHRLLLDTVRKQEQEILELKKEIEKLKNPSSSSPVPKSNLSTM